MGYINGMMTQTRVVGQDPFHRETWRAWNRTGAALTQYGVYQFDTGLTAALETTANSLGMLLPAVTTYNWGNRGIPDSSSAWHNVVAVAAEKLTSGVFCVALEPTSDNEVGEMLVIGRLSSIKGIGVASTTYTAGSFLRATTGQVYLTHRLQSLNATFSNTEAYTLASKNVAMSLAAYTEAGTPAATALDMFFNGFGIGGG